MIVGKNGCDLKGKYLLNRKSRRIVGKNACVPRKKYPLYQERWNLVGKFKFCTYRNTFVKRDKVKDYFLNKIKGVYDVKCGQQIIGKIMK